MSEYLETDVLIIGSGIAGGIAALKLSENGFNIILINRADDLLESNTVYAQGGIIYENPAEKREELIKDILHAGDGICYKKAVEMLAEQGPELVNSILVEQLGIRFDSDDKGYSLVAEGGHSKARIVHAADHTGRTIQQAIVNAVKKDSKIAVLNAQTAIDLLTPGHHSLERTDAYEHPRCVGAYVFDQFSCEVKRIIARETILATGGLGRIYQSTTNPSGARGDGIAMANRAGARILNMEYIQFHPTTLYHEKGSHFLISEAARGTGARLMNHRGHYFMDDYEPQWKDLAHRDIVARAIHNEMLKNDEEYVFLDFKSFMSVDEVKTKFPTIYETCLKLDIDITSDPAPVVPAAHYSCGGIWVDEFGRTSINNLFAIGEVACTGVHGANRLASTSLLESLVWANQAAQYIANKKSSDLFKHKKLPSWELAQEFEPDPALLAQDMSNIRNIMWNYVGLVRNKHRLQRAIRELRHLEVEVETFYRKSNLSDALIGLRNSVRASILVTDAAWKNKRSIGCHFREDFPG